MRKLLMSLFCLFLTNIAFAAYQPIPPIPISSSNDFQQAVQSKWKANQTAISDQVKKDIANQKPIALPSSEKTPTTTTAPPNVQPFAPGSTTSPTQPTTPSTYQPYTTTTTSPPPATSTTTSPSSIYTGFQPNSNTGTGTATGVQQPSGSQWNIKY